ncbi:MAG: lipopolysaccharide assembly protein LapA domain-containing protein [Cyanobacteria bacterium P01_A01_bin.114]
MPLFIIFALVIAFFAIAFALQNNNLVTINLLVWQLQESLAIVLLSTLALGVLVGLLVTIPSLIKRDWRTSRAKKQATGLETQLMEKDREISTQLNKVDGLRQSYENLLQSLNLTDTTTGLLHSRLVHQTLTALLHQMKLQPLNDQFQAVALLTLQAQRTEPATVKPKQDVALWDAIAELIRRNITVDTWLYSDGYGRFMCTLTGFDLKAVNQYAETLQNAITEQPVTTKDGQRVTVDLDIGGVVADRDHPTESEQLMLDRAQQALEQGQKRGKNRIRIIRVTD